MHLRDAESFCDLGLGQLLHESQGEDLALAWGEVSHHLLEDVLHLDTIEVVVGQPEPVPEGERFVAATDALHRRCSRRR
jgi:hypothetical protein